MHIRRHKITPKNRPSQLSEKSAYLEVGGVGQVLDNHIGGKNANAAAIEVEGDVLRKRGPAEVKGRDNTVKEG